MKELDSSLFDWLTWRRGCPLDVFGIGCRRGDLFAKRDELRRYAIGWCRSDRLMCRPKMRNIAVMFEIDGTLLWFHMLESEFRGIYL
jgi:hypothetical protein